LLLVLDFKNLINNDVLPSLFSPLFSLLVTDFSTGDSHTFLLKLYFQVATNFILNKDSSK